MPICIITGMHRSGTSLIASLFHKAGVDMGERLIPPGRCNPRGFFEDADFYKFHEKLLRERGETILVSRDFSFEPTPDETRQARVLIKQQRERPVWGWKDPRTSLFLEFWHQLLPNAYFFLVYRHPLDVLLSLMRRKELYNAGLLEGIEAWYTYNLRIKNFYERYPETSLLCDTYGIVKRINEFRELLSRKFELDLHLDASVLNSVYHPTELRRAPLMSDIESTLRIIHPESVELYELLNSMADLPSQPDHNISGHLPDLSALSNFISALTGPQHASRRRGLLFLLCSFVAPEVIETFFGEHIKDIKELEQGKNWLEEQRANWQRIAEEKEAVIREKEAVIRRVDECLTKFRLKPLLRLATRLKLLRLRIDNDQG